ncbi:H/ACA RNA-protein complex protein Gar1 [Metallosphaera hakonensis JCM 8857 = DSM 7519]|uniref:H/ACA RNA-protein complex protein Gar1 n=1 Tax=Metallosphaera hakonensis JCM 8857 = DSM 7519 TaxID=1293036 RepID=A0A2U9IXP5_9CREN|nr:H/ACA RNA-protein complex protein Gar1 [Metallosphaera hakonensis]AWS00676.1 H/ACA RNA-protein complex protein Gar1 [Metallosphaera hakonensis JCM 8857 = DSM 7519]
MRSTKLVPIGTLKSIVLEDKWLIQGDPNHDYSKVDPSGLVILDSRQRRVGKVLDVLGNIRSPYLLVEPLTKDVPNGKLVLEVPQSKHHRKHRR